MSGDGKRLTHVDERGHAHMVDVGSKPDTRRRAVARAFVEMHADTEAMISQGTAAKGDVLAVARVAGIMAAKRTSDLVPLCHPIALTSVSVEMHVGTGTCHGVEIVATAETTGPTGVEMEALTAASIAALTIYDMCKAVDRGMVIGGVQLLHKEGGASGTWTRGEEEL